MKTAIRITAIAGVTALIASPLAFATAATASADIDRHGTCGAGVYKLSVDRERGGYEVDADLDGVKPGSTWTFVIRHNGKRLTKLTRTADREGEVDVDAYAKNTVGKDKFAFVAKSGSVKCGAHLSVA